VGDAAALSFVLTAAMIVVVGIQLWATRRREGN
jgi:ABC-type sugar transport system permease subunit